MISLKMRQRKDAIAARICRAAAVLLLASLHAAPQEAQPAFEVISVKRDVSGQPGPQYRMFPRFIVQRATLPSSRTARTFTESGV
jgi:hypothetical protein